MAPTVAMAPTAPMAPAPTAKMAHNGKQLGPVVLYWLSNNMKKFRGVYLNMHKDDCPPGCYIVKFLLETMSKWQLVALCIGQEHMHMVE